MENEMHFIFPQLDSARFVSTHRELIHWNKDQVGEGIPIAIYQVFHQYNVFSVVLSQTHVVWSIFLFQFFSYMLRMLGLVNYH